jgi:Short C-terminal domain
MRRRGRPGLAGTMARTAVIAGTATAVSGGMTRRANQRAMESQQAEAYQQQQEAEQMAAMAAAAAPPPPPAAAPAGEDDTVAKLTQLADLKAQGILSDEEFAAAKAKLLGT